MPTPAGGADAPAGAAPSPGAARAGGLPVISLPALAAPLVVSFTARSLLTAVDLPYASRLGDAAVAAIGLSFPLEFCFIACWVGLSGAMTSHLSRALGARDEARIAQVTAVAARVAVALAAAFLALAAATWALAPRLGLEDPAVVDAFRIYAPTLLAGCAVLGFWSVVPDSIVKAHHRMRVTMVAGLLSGAGNLALNTLFVFVFEWGIFGIALATNLGRGLALAYALWHARALERERRRDWARADAAPAAPPPGPLARPYAALLALAVPTALTYVLMASEGAVANWVLAGTAAPTAAIAAYAIFHRAALLFLMPVVATGVATVPFVARGLGEGRGALVRRGLGQAYALGHGYALLVVAPVCLLVAGPLARFLGRSAEAVELAQVAIRWGTPAAVLASVSFVVARAAFEGTQRGAPGLVMATLRYVVLSAPLAWVGARVAEGAGLPGFHGVLAGLVTGTAVASLVFGAWLVRDVRAGRLGGAA